MVYLIVVFKGDNEWVGTTASKANMSSKKYCKSRFKI